jgi:hypothetical protein
MKDTNTYAERYITIPFFKITQVKLVIGMSKNMLFSEKT